jgi:hypothetical protein
MEAIKMDIEKHLGLLGHEVRDKVSDYKGVVISISFDLFGCVQALVRPMGLKDGDLQNGNWLDLSRLRVISSKPLMLPNYADPPGPAKKPHLGCGVKR